MVDKMSEKAGGSPRPSVPQDLAGGVLLCPRCDRPPAGRPKEYPGPVQSVARTLGILMKSVVRPLVQNAVMSQRRI